MSDGLTPAELVSAIKEHKDKLNTWERGFVNDIAGKVQAGYGLSERQIDKLNAIYEDYVG